LQLECVQVGLLAVGKALKNLKLLDLGDTTSGTTNNLNLKGSDNVVDLILLEASVLQDLLDGLERLAEVLLVEPEINVMLLELGADELGEVLALQV
jgi:hypothetical protein